jgi:hypothetical protein
MSPSWEEDSPRGKGPARHTFQVHPTWDGWAEGTGGNDFLAENRHFRSECLSKVERERRIKTKEPKLGFSLSSPNLDFIYLLGAHAQIGRILSGSSLVPFPVLLSIPMFESGWQISEEPGLLPAPDEISGTQCPFSQQRYLIFTHCMELLFLRQNKSLKIGFDQ